MHSFRSTCHVVFLLLCLIPLTSTYAGPSDYSLRVKVGPSFNLNDWENQVRLGGEFDYELGYNLGFNLAALFGISDDFRFDLIPSIRYSYLYIGPAALFGLFGVGYAVYKDQNALDMRVGTGINIPLGERYEFNTDVNLFFAPLGTPGTPVTLDWMIGFGGRFY